MMDKLKTMVYATTILSKYCSTEVFREPNQASSSLCAHILDSFLAMQAGYRMLGSSFYLHRTLSANGPVYPQEVCLLL